MRIVNEPRGQIDVGSLFLDLDDMHRGAGVRLPAGHGIEYPTVDSRDLVTFPGQLSLLKSASRRQQLHRGCMGAELTVHDVYAGDVVAKRSEIDALSFSEFPQIQPLVRGTLQRPVVEIESIDVGVNFH